MGRLKRGHVGGSPPLFLFSPSSSFLIPVFLRLLALPRYQASTRNAGIQFGPDVTAAFAHDNNVALIVRSHECVQQGAAWQKGKKLITVFSASLYSGYPNNGAVLEFKRVPQGGAAEEMEAKPKKASRSRRGLSDGEGEGRGGGGGGDGAEKVPVLRFLGRSNRRKRRRKREKSQKSGTQSKSERDHRKGQVEDIWASPQEYEAFLVLRNPGAAGVGVAGASASASASASAGAGAGGGEVGAGGGAGAGAGGGSEGVMRVGVHRYVVDEYAFEAEMEERAQDWMWRVEVGVSVLGDEDYKALRAEDEGREGEEEVEAGKGRWVPPAAGSGIPAEVDSRGGAGGRGMGGEGGGDDVASTSLTDTPSPIEFSKFWVDGDGEGGAGDEGGPRKQRAKQEGDIRSMLQQRIFEKKSELFWFFSKADGEWRMFAAGRGGGGWNVGRSL
jgi:hypothetical protein